MLRRLRAGRGGGRGLVGLAEVHAARVAGSARRGRGAVARLAFLAAAFAAAASTAGALTRFPFGRRPRGFRARGALLLPPAFRLPRCAAGLEALDLADLDLAVDEPFDRAQQRAVLGADE